MTQSRDDTAELTAFCVAQYPRLVGAMTLYCQSRELAQEVASETVARICLRWKSVQRLQAPGAWAHRVAVNLTNSHFRRRSLERRAWRRASTINDQSIAHQPTATTIALRGELAKLPRRQRMALVLRFYSDLPLAEVAEAMGCSIGTVKSHLHKATRKLRENPNLEDLKEDWDD